MLAPLCLHSPSLSPTSQAPQNQSPTSPSRAGPGAFVHPQQERREWVGSTPGKSPSRQTVPCQSTHRLPGCCCPGLDLMADPDHPAADEPPACARAELPYRCTCLAAC